MIKSNSSSVDPCGGGTTSECVTWQGEDITCLGIEKGQTLSVSIKKVADEVCDLMDQLDLNDLDLKCLFSLCVDCPEPIRTLKVVLELLINKICSLEDIINNLDISGETGTDPIINLASCFQYTDADGDLITELPHTLYTKRIANQVCQILLRVSSLEDDVSDLQDITTSLQEQIDALELNIPDVSSDCLFVGTKSIDDAWDLLDQAFCQLRTGVGLTTDINIAISRQCAELNDEFAAAPGWKASPANLAESINNLWIAFCATKATTDGCCAVSCSDISLGFSASFNGDNTEITLKFTFGAGTSIPDAFTDGGSTGTITDVDGNVESFNLTIENNAEIVVPVSSLNVNEDVVIEINAILEAEGLTCQKCLSKTLKSSACGFCEITAEGEEGSSAVIIYEDDGLAAVVEISTTSTSTTTTTTTL